VDHFQDRATQILRTVLFAKAAIWRYMNYCDKATLRLPKMHIQKLLMLRWRSFSEWGRECAAVVFAHKGGQYFIYGCLQPITTEITHNAKPNISNARLMLIFRIGQWLCHFLFCLYWLPLHSLCLTTTRQLVNYLSWKTKNRWRSVDTEFVDVVTKISSIVSPEISANTLCMKSNHKSTLS